MSLRINKSVVLDTDDGYLKCNFIDWKNASENDVYNYKMQLDKELNNILVPWSAVNCKFLDCASHDQEISAFYNDIVKACIDASKLSIVNNRKKNVNNRLHKVVPGWSDYVKSHKANALFWHNMEKSWFSQKWVHCINEN